MKIVLMISLLLSTLLLATNSEFKKKSIEQRHLEIQMEKEKKYSREQIFYNSSNYDFKGAEVNKESLKNIQVPEVQDDFDMDNVYD